MEALRAAVAASPILVPALRTTDWAELCHSADPDAAILAWIAGHVRGRSVRPTLH
jgi:hypothetical protein